MSKSVREENILHNKADLVTKESTASMALDKMLPNLETVVAPRSFAHTVRSVVSALLLIVWILVMLPVFVIFKYVFVSRLDVFYKTFHHIC